MSVLGDGGARWTSKPSVVTHLAGPKLNPELSSKLSTKLIQTLSLAGLPAHSNRGVVGRLENSPRGHTLVERLFPSAQQQNQEESWGGGGEINSWEVPREAASSKGMPESRPPSEMPTTTGNPGRKHLWLKRTGFSARDGGMCVCVCVCVCVSVCV